MPVCVETFVLTCRSGSVPAIVGALEAPLVGRAGFLGCWTTDLGALNEIVVLFSQTPQDIVWPDHAAGVERIDRQRWTLIGGTQPAPGAFGGAYEWRVYDILPGREAEVTALMEGALPARSAVSPAYLVMTSSDGVSRLAHAWPYADLAERAARRKQAVETGAWPPKGILPLLGAMKSAILVPVGYSPSC
ncbi:NIPSNAP family protein [Asaia sp. W19]|uniref:NIPSNAP family protein n=1 Tax=unclassified Asaia TaxID=2685023 RepID=UPI000F8F4629|nr:NIPSNAP family protein [Asaia sp. W19]RUT25244.1 NIPSNAP family protein [Asaia sp. W19]